MRRVFYILIVITTIIIMFDPINLFHLHILATINFIRLDNFNKKMQLCKTRTQRYASFIFICFISSRDFRLLVNVRASACVRERERKNKTLERFLLMSVFLVLCIEQERLYRKVLERNLSREGVFRFVRRALVANKQCNAQVKLGVKHSKFLNWTYFKFK
jgi:hypothetical protein